MTWKETAMGPALQSLSASSTSSPWVMLKLPWRTQPTAMALLKTHCPSLAVQGQVTSDSSPPACLMYSKACEGSPPLQPKFSQSPAQSTSCCSEKVMFLPLPRMFQCDSIVPTVEKAQQDPQDAWFLTGETMPQLFHSQLSGMAAFLSSSFTLKALVAEHSWGAMSLSSLNSSKVMSAKSLMPCCQESRWELWLRMASRFSRKTLNRQSDFWVQGEWNWSQIYLAMSWLKGESPLSSERYLMLRCRLHSAAVTSSARSRIFDIRYNRQPSEGNLRAGYTVGNRVEQYRRVIQKSNTVEIIPWSALMSVMFKQSQSFLVGSLLLDVEVLDLVGGAVGGDHVEELPEAVLLEVLLGEVLQVSLGEIGVGLDRDALIVTVHADHVSETACPAGHLDAGAQELREVGSVEDLVLDGLGAVDGEGVGDLCLDGLLLEGLGLGEGGLGLFCGHYIIYIN